MLKVTNFIPFSVELGKTPQSFDYSDPSGKDGANPYRDMPRVCQDFYQVWRKGHKDGNGNTVINGTLLGCTVTKEEGSVATSNAKAGTRTASVNKDDAPTANELLALANDAIASGMTIEKMRNHSVALYVKAAAEYDKDQLVLKQMLLRIAQTTDLSLIPAIRAFVAAEEAKKAVA